MNEVNRLSQSHRTKWYAAAKDEKHKRVLDKAFPSKHTKADFCADANEMYFKSHLLIFVCGRRLELV